MKTKIKYFIYFLLILILNIVICSIGTNSKYISTINMESNVQIGAMIFNVKNQDENIDAYELVRGEEITVNYKLSNKDENNNINQMELKYYLKIVDVNNNEDLPLEITVDGYEYIQYKVDEDGNIVNEDGNIVDENGNIIKEQELTSEENEELQKTLRTVKKGFGEINLSYDGKSADEKELNIKIKCPEDYEGEEILNYNVKIIAEGIVDKDFLAEETAELKINIKDIEIINVEKNEEIQNDINTQSIDLQNEEKQSQEQEDNIEIENKTCQEQEETIEENTTYKQQVEIIEKDVTSLEQEENPETEDI